MLSPIRVRLYSLFIFLPNAVTLFVVKCWKCLKPGFNTSICEETKHSMSLANRVTTSGFLRKRKKESGSEFSGNIISFALRSLNNNMAGSNRMSTSSRSGRRRESLEETNQGESLAFNKQFIELLRKLPDELLCLERKINILEREVKASPTR